MRNRKFCPSDDLPRPNSLITLTSHHHHVHAHTPNRPDDEIQVLPQQPTQFLNRFAPASVTPTGTPHHHHHHIHPTPHHHHHPPKQQQAVVLAPPTPIPRPTVKINNQPVLDSIKHLPRRHLGSEVYGPTVSAAPLAAPGQTPLTALNHKTALSSKFRLRRRFTDNDINCTYTIRIPRYYLSPEERERLCTDRRIWGSGIYSDDSDPLAAAIHAGWLRGEWSDDVDVEMLDLDPTSKTQPDADDDQDLQSRIDEELEITTPPSSGPIPPPPERDLQITLLILPTLARYPSSILHGVQSREWAVAPPAPADPTSDKPAQPLSRTAPKPTVHLAPHDGLSFSIHSLRFVDEGPAPVSGAGVGRDAESRRKRAAANALLNLRLWGEGESATKKLRAGSEVGVATGMGGRGMVVAA